MPAARRPHRARARPDGVDDGRCRRCAGGRSIGASRGDACASARPSPSPSSAGSSTDAGAKRAGDEVVPAALRLAALALGAAHDQPVDRARHRDIEQPAVLVLGLAARRSRAAATGATSVAFGPAQTKRSGAPGAPSGRQRQQPRLALRRPRRRRRGVGEDHDRRLQPLGAVHGHHPHLVAGDLHVALHVGPGRAQPGDEALQRRASRGARSRARD